MAAETSGQIALIPWASLVAQMLKNLPAILETQVWFYPLQCLAWRIPFTSVEFFRELLKELEAQRFCRLVLGDKAPSE